LLLPGIAREEHMPRTHAIPTVTLQMRQAHDAEEPENEFDFAGFRVHLDPEQRRVVHAISMVLQDIANFRMDITGAKGIFRANRYALRDIRNRWVFACLAPL